MMGGKVDVKMTGDCSLSVKKFEFPECWSNDIRMSALFAPFRSKSMNPTDWASKMKFWTSLIENWCKCNKCPVIEINTLKNCFSRKGLVPACLEEVLAYLVSTGVLADKESFMVADENWKSWAFKILVTNPLKWTFNTVKNTITKGKEVKKNYYVHLTVVKHLSDELQKIASAYSQGKIVTFDELVQWGFETPESLSIVLHWMQKQGLVAVSHENDLMLIKLPKNTVKPVEITEIDLGIYSLEKQQKLLEDNITKLETERNAALEETKKHLAAKMKTMAKIWLRRKKELDKTIEKRATTLDNIQAILHKIEQAKIDTEVIETYQKGIATLKQIFRETGLSTETVTGTMNELEEVLNNRNEIEEALAKPMDPELEENLEDELNQLLLKDVPEVPKELPVTFKNEKKKNKETDEVNARLAALSL